MTPEEYVAIKAAPPKATRLAVRADLGHARGATGREYSVQSEPLRTEWVKVTKYNGFDRITFAVPIADLKALETAIRIARRSLE